MYYLNMYPDSHDEPVSQKDTEGDDGEGNVDSTVLLSLYSEVGVVVGSTIIHRL